MNKLSTLDKRLKDILLIQLLEECNELNLALRDGSVIQHVIQEWSQVQWLIKLYEKVFGRITNIGSDTRQVEIEDLTKQFCKVLCWGEVNSTGKSHIHKLTDMLSWFLADKRQIPGVYFDANAIIRKKSDFLREGFTEEFLTV